MVKVIEMKCRNCGAPVTRQGNELVCDYCHSRVLLSLDDDPESEALTTGDEWADHAGTLYKEGKYQKTIEACQQALRLGLKKHPPALVHTIIGNAHDQLGQYEQAIPAHQRALDLDPNFYKAWVNLGVVYRHMSNFDQAEFCYQQALRINPDYPELYISLGALYIHRNESQKAIAILEKAIVLDPSIAMAHANIAIAYAAAGRIEDAEKSLSQAIIRGYKNYQTVNERIEAFRLVYQNKKRA